MASDLVAIALKIILVATPPFFAVLEMSDYLCPRSKWADSLQEVRRLVDEEGVNPWKCFCKLNGFTTPLHHFCARGNLHVVKYLIEEKHCNPNILDGQWCTPLQYACMHGHLDVIKYLIKTGPRTSSCHSVDQYGSTPLDYACAYGHMEVVKYLIETGSCDPNGVDQYGRTALHYACWNEHIDVVKYLIETAHTYPNFKDHYGSTPLHYASWNEHMEVVEYLIETGCDPKCKNQDGSTPLHYACWNDHMEMIKYLIETGHCDPNCVDDYGRTPLHYACEHMEVIKYLTETVHCDPNCVDKYGRTPLHYACDHGQNMHIELAKYLIETACCNPNCVNQDGDTPLHYATRNEHVEMVKYLIETGRCDHNCADRYGRTPLHYACAYNYTELVKYLIETGLCNPNCVDQDGDTPLLYATKKEQIEMVKCLIETGRCDYNCTDKCGRTPLHYVCMYNYMEVAKYLIETDQCDPDCVDQYGNAPLHYACQIEHMELIKYLIETGCCDPNCKDSTGMLPLHYLCNSGSLCLVKYLVEEKHCDPNCVDRKKMTPLHYAIDNEHMEVINFLIETGHCDPNHVDQYGTALYYAVTNEHLKVVKYLIETGRCDPNCVDQNGLTPLLYATKMEHMEMVKCLIETGCCDLNCVDQNGLTPLLCATKMEHMEMVKCLIETGCCDLNCVDQNGLTPLLCATKMEHMEMVKCLIETGHCNPDCVDEDGSTPLHYAFWKEHVELIKCLIETGHCDLNHVDEDGSTPLQYAFWNGDVDLIKYLIETGHCDLNHVDEDGSTPLHYAFWNGDMDLIKYLIETGHCDLNCLDQYGYAPLHYAIMYKHEEMINYLVDIGHCDPNCANRDGNTALHLVIHSGRPYRSLQLFEWLIESCNCDPEHVNSDGWTPLHLASNYGHSCLVSYLLVECHCNPNCKTIDGYTPLDLAVNFPGVTRELVNAGAKPITKLPQPPVKVFIVGNPSAGKSSLTKALQTETSALGAAMASLTGPRLVQDVEPQTAGIIPCQFTSKQYGHVIFYDFAGQQEYYASHAALIRHSISSSAPLLIIVVNLCDSEEDIKQKLAYWISLLANQCISLTVDPHVIIVGSHKDVVKSKGEDPKAKVSSEFLQKICVSNGFVLSKFIPMDCRQSNSRDIVKLAESMKESCDALREELVVTHRLHHLFTHLLEEFKYTPAVTLKKVLQSSSSYTFKRFRLSARNPDYLHTSCVSLNDRGHILYLRHTDISKSWIILDQAVILSEVNGVLFAPTGFTQNCKLATGTTGIVPLSRLVARFPHHDSDMLVQLLSQLEFCCEILDHEVLQLVSQDLSPQNEIEDPSNEHYLFFPGLISTDVPSCVWEAKSHFSQFCGWMLQCCEAGHLLTSQFLQVVLLRLAFSCALAPDDLRRDDHTVLKRKCSIWKNGIYWGTRNGVEALVEIRDPPQHRQVVVMLRCVSGHEVDCAHLRSTIIKTVLKVKKNLCHKVSTEEFFLQPSQVMEYPFKTPAKEDLLSIREVSRAVVEGGSSIVDSSGRSVILSDILFVEPYAHLGEDILQNLFSKGMETIPDKILYSIAASIYNKEDQYIHMLKLNRAQLEEKVIQEAPAGPCNKFMCVLQCWRGDSGTYESLRETLDQFSVFATRNPLVSDQSNLHYC